MLRKEPQFKMQTCPNGFVNYIVPIEDQDENGNSITLALWQTEQEVLTILQYFKKRRPDGKVEEAWEYTQGQVTTILAQIDWRYCLKIMYPEAPKMLLRQLHIAPKSISLAGLSTFQRVALLRNQGFTDMEIAFKLEKTLPTIKKYPRDVAKKITLTTKTKPTDSEIRLMYNNGAIWSQRSLANQLGVPLSAIRHAIVNRHNK